MKTHAWVLPPQPSVSHRFVVAWNGLVYPALSIGDKANLKDDVLAAVKSDEDDRAKSAKASPGQKYHFVSAAPEPQTAAHSSLLPLKASLLLRLGENLLAEQVWAAWTAGMDREPDAFHLQDPYIMLASGWLWPRLHRAVCEHMRRDDRLALYDARFINFLLYDITNVVEKRSASWPGTYSSKYAMQDYFTFLGPVPALFADQERRSKEKRVRWPVQSIVAKHDKQAERIAALILELDEATAYQRGQPGGINMSEDAVVQELIKQGAAAVEPLLIVLEHDNRLTRSVRFHRDFSFHRHIITVYETAYQALATILKISSKEEDADWEDIMKGRRAVVAARLRALWNKQKS
ncbi:MAG TPA: hypothetical protein VFH31_03235 [Pyrinomonadaceae bacterium]|nr:hypothetical protein [Pyrinomonadaceae bacterium]